MKLITLETWDEREWRRVRPVYEEAFPHGAKTESILRAILDRRIGHLHVGYMDEEENLPAAMAVTGVTSVDGRKALVIDYMAVRGELRSNGIGRQFLALLQHWGLKEFGIQGVVIEVEAAETPENRRRMLFWERCGFRPTAYVHQYRWVPEPYRAMVLQLEEPPVLPEEGEQLFRYIIAFHEKAYRRR